MPDESLPPVYIKARYAGDAAKVWTLNPLEVEIAGPSPSAATPSAPGIGFYVPLLPRGDYVAWYELPGQRGPQQTLSLRVQPLLRAREALVADAPGQDVEVQVGVEHFSLLERGKAAPEERSVRITLRSEKPAVADLAAGQPAAAATGRDGFAAWKVRLKGAGAARLVAEAEGFDSVELYVVGRPALAATAQARQAQDQLRASRRTVWQEEGQASVAEAELDRERLKEQVARAELAGTMRTAEASDSTRQAKLREVEGMRARVAVAEQRAARESADAGAAVASYTAAAARASRAAAAPVTPAAEAIGGDDYYDRALLKPGDVLLVKGQTPFLSRAIMAFERQQLGREAPYSHAALYLGTMNIRGVETHMVGEMWLQGFWITPLDVSVSDALVVDVYRRTDLSDAQRETLKQAGRAMFGAVDNFVCEKSPPCWRKLLKTRPYAALQIKLLADAASLLMSPGDLLAKASEYDLLSRGKRSLICSEYVAWAYHDAGLELRIASWWRTLDAAGVLSTVERRKDYTTPNMLFYSPDLKREGCLRGCELGL
jgi:hypothetical protein